MYGCTDLTPSLPLLSGTRWTRDCESSYRRLQQPAVALLDPAHNPFPHTPPARVRTRLVAFDFVPDGALQSR